MNNHIAFRRARFKVSFFVAATLLFAVNCTTVHRLVQSTRAYHTEAYEEAVDEWSREGRIHRGLEVELIASVTFKSEAFRWSYADEYAEAYQLTPEEKARFVQDQLKAATLGHEFVMAIFVPEKKKDDFDKAKSIWRVYLVNDENERVVPVEVRRLKAQNAVTPHFFPYITPWKSVYTVRFPYNSPESNRPFIRDDASEMKLIITSVLGTSEMHWNLE